MANALKEKLPQTPNTVAIVAAAVESEVAADAQAARGEAPNNQMPIAIIHFLAAGIGPGTIAIETRACSEVFHKYTDCSV